LGYINSMWESMAKASFTFLRLVVSSLDGSMILYVYFWDVSKTNMAII